eukprot:TRINITY_DN12095_c4_g4_i2.p1 TRINITY_DN12095_c4_g4~~TRINITY_DN12095_c4_g4_i2.p1  ORF type:complete len:1120 (+),score=355.80 TRINITY_DN12095_c4_g4_i2:92-3361(+)
MSEADDDDDGEELIVLTPSLLAQLLAGRHHLSALGGKKKGSKKALPPQLSGIWREGAVLTEAPYEIVKSADLAHPVWGLIVQHVLSLEAEEGLRLWQHYVDEGLLRDKGTTTTRKSIAFNLMQMVASQVPLQQLPSYISPKLLSILVSNACERKNVLNEPARAALRAIAARGSDEDADDDFRLSMLSTLLGPNGSQRFDKLTHTNCVATLLRSLTCSGLQSWVLEAQRKVMQPKVDGDDDDDEDDRMTAVTRLRLAAMEQLGLVSRTAHFPRTEDLLMGLLEFFFTVAFATVEAGAKLPKHPGRLSNKDLVPTAPFIKRERAYALDRFNHLLKYLTAAGPIKSDEEEASAKDRKHMKGCNAEGEPRLHHIVEFVIKVAKAKNVTLAHDWSESQRQGFDIAVKLAKATKASKADSSLDAAFEQLFHHTVLLFFTDPALANSVVVDLERTYAGLSKGKATRRVKAKLNPAEPHPSEVLTDVLLSFLAQGAAPLRKLVDVVFRSACSSMTTGAIDLLLDVLASDNPNDGDGVMDEESDGEDIPESGDDEDEGDSDGDDDEDDDNDDDGDDEEDDNDDDGDDDDDDSDDDDDDDDGDDDDNDDKTKSAKRSANRIKLQGPVNKRAKKDSNDEEVDPEFRRKIAQALEMPESIDALVQNEEEEEEESDWDDDRMMEVDAAIAKHFREHRKRTKKAKVMERLSTIHFKTRVVDLLDRFTFEEPSSPLILELIPGLIQAYDQTEMYKKEQTGTLQMRLQTVLVKRVCTNGNIRITLSEEDVERVHVILEDVCGVLKRSNNRRMLAMASASVLFLINQLAMTHIPEKNARKQARKDNRDLTKLLDTDRFNQMFLPVVKTFMTHTKCILTPDLFIDMSNLFPNLGWEMLPTFCECLPSASKDFRRKAVWEMLLTVLKNESYMAAHPEVVTGNTDTLLRGAIITLKQAAPESGSLKLKSLRRGVRGAFLVLKALLAYSPDAVDKEEWHKLLDDIALSKGAYKSPPMRTLAEQMLKELDLPIPAPAARVKRQKVQFPTGPDGKRLTKEQRKIRKKARKLEKKASKMEERRKVRERNKAKKQAVLEKYQGSGVDDKTSTEA